jgi:hypothetical protein
VQIQRLSTCNLVAMVTEKFVRFKLVHCGKGFIMCLNGKGISVTIKFRKFAYYFSPLVKILVDLLF